MIDSLQTHYPNFKIFTYEEQCELVFPLMKDVKVLQPDTLLRCLEQKPKKFIWTAGRVKVLQEVIDSLQTQHPNFHSCTNEQQCELVSLLMKDVKELQSDTLLRCLEKRPNKFYWTADRVKVLQDVIDSLRTQHPNFDSCSNEEQCELVFPLIDCIVTIQQYFINTCIFIRIVDVCACPL